MIFQTLDEKKECFGIYANGVIEYERIPKDLTATWSYAPYLGGMDIRYASLYAGDCSIANVVPERFLPEWERVSKKINAFRKSLNTAKVNLNDNCLYELVPERFIVELCEIKNKVTKYIIENYDRPPNYNFLVDLSKVINDLSFQKLNFDFAELRQNAVDYKGRQWYKKLKKTEPYIRYNIFGTKTGRLTTKKDTFPILTLPKNYRSVLKPNNDWFVELDFNGAELRTLMALTGHKQLPGDIHEWNKKILHDKNSDHPMTRDETKKEIFSWLYNSKEHEKEKLLLKAYDKNYVKKKFWNGKSVNTVFGRDIPSDEHHALNYIIQSTCADLILRQMIKIHEVLKDKKSKIAFCVHDSIVIDFSVEDRYILKDLIKQFSDTELGTFKVNVQAGQSYGKMMEISL
jgi:hypothetical protein|tara:strand:+ start:793 stop:1998 length:1206 start_codon:yes stop_codon:yes gene_type:complete